MRNEGWGKFLEAYEQLKTLNSSSNKIYKMTYKVKLGGVLQEVMGFEELYSLYSSNFATIIERIEEEFLISKLYNYHSEDVVKNSIMAMIARSFKWQL